jgi:hypothetical protein
LEVRVLLPFGGEEKVSLPGSSAVVRDVLLAAGLDISHVGAVVRSSRILSMGDEVRQGEVLTVLPPLDGG